MFAPNFLVLQYPGPPSCGVRNKTAHAPTSTIFGITECCLARQMDAGQMGIPLALLVYDSRAKNQENLMFAEMTNFGNLWNSGMFSSIKRC